MSSKITKVIANFSTQLATKMSVGDTTGFLKSPVKDSDGVQISDGLYVMTANMGESNEEHLLFTLNATTGAMSNVTSITRQGVESSGAKKEHRGSAKVFLTDFANLYYIAKILNGEIALDGANPLKYDATPTFTDALQIINKGYADAIITGLLGTASMSIAGTVFTTKNAGAKPRVKTTWINEQSTPDKTLKVEAVRLSFADRLVAYNGGNTPNFIDPALGGDLAINTNPSNGETVVITVDGTPVTFTFVTTIGSNQGNVLIGGSASVSRANLVNLINNPSVTNANQVAFTAGNLTAIQKLSATDDLSLNAFIRVINTSTTTFSVVENLAGGGNVWTANTTKTRYDLVVIDGSNALQIRKGVEAVSPTIPTPQNNDVVICAVLNRIGQTTVRAYDVSGQAYVTDYYDLGMYKNDLTPLGVISPYAGSTSPSSSWLLCDGSAISRSTYASLFTLLGTTYGSGDGSTTFNIPDLRGRSPIGVGTGTKVATFSSRASNVITVTGLSNISDNEFQTGTPVLYLAPSGAMTGLTHNTIYYIIKVTNTTFSLATSLANANAGTAIALSSNGTGVQTFTVSLSARTLGDTGGEEKHLLSIAEMASHFHGLTQMQGTGSGYNFQAWGQSNFGANATNDTDSKGGDTQHNNIQPFIALNYIIKAL